MKRAMLLGAAGAIALGGVVVWQAAPEDALYEQPDVVALGQTLYQGYCASCHGAKLQGEPNWRERDADGYLPAPPHDATGHTWHHSDEQLLAITTLGTETIVGRRYKSRMPGFGDDLDRDQILSILAYIKSTWPPEIIARHDEINQSG